MAQEYEQTQVVAASPEEVLAWVSNVGNMPKYLPPIKEASIEGESASGTRGERVRLRGEIPDRGEFDGEGYPSAYESARRVEWVPRSPGTTPAGSRSRRRTAAAR